MTKRHVLWVEDAAADDLSELAAPVIIDGRYNLDIALTSTDAVAHIHAREYSCVIVDIRLPPGTDRFWEERYTALHTDKIGARLGMILLQELLAPTEDRQLTPAAPRWLTPKKIGIMSVEKQQEVSSDLRRLGIEHYVEKSAQNGRLALLHLINRICGEA